MLLLLSCARSIPPALLVDAEGVGEDAPEPTDPAARVAWIVGEDPLVRRPRVPTADLDPPLVAWRTVARAGVGKPTDWAEIEAAWPGTVVVPLARGARLAALETSLDDASAAFGWVLPLPVGTIGQDQVREPLAWLGGEKREALLPIVERDVLLGWLDGPAIPVDAPARALAASTYDRLATTPAGRLVTARAAHPSDPAAGASGRASLEEATWIAAMAAAADRDAEQAALRTLVADAGTRAGIAGNPTRALLGRAFDDLAKDAGSDASAGLALVSAAALRWEGGCPDAPCGGFGRVRALEAAARWAPEVVPFADAWRVIAAKDAYDRLEAAWDEPSFPAALDGEVEVLLGTGAAVDRTVLLYPHPGPPVQLALSRAAGGGDLTGKDDLLHTLRARLAKAAADAGKRVPARIGEPLARIARRAEGSPKP